MPERPPGGKVFGRSLFAEMARFLVTGAGATALDVLLFWLLVSLFPAHGKACFAVSFCTSVLCRFFADKRFTFVDTAGGTMSGKTGRQLLMYFASSLGTMVVGLGVYSLCLRFASGPLLAKLVSIPFVTASGFLLFKLVVFRPRSGGTNPDGMRPRLPRGSARPEE